MNDTALLDRQGSTHVRAQVMPLPELEDVIQEIGRLLKPGGTFAAVVSGDLPPGDAYAAFLAIWRELFLREGQVFTAFSASSQDLHRFISESQDILKFYESKQMLPHSRERLREGTFLLSRRGS